MDGTKNDVEMSGEGMECGREEVGGTNDEQNSYDGSDFCVEGTANETCHFDGGVGEGESGSGVEAAYTVAQRLDAVDAKLADLCMGMAVVSERLSDLITLSNNQVEGSNGKREVVTALVFESYVDQAIASGHSAFGVSRCFIQEYITKTFSLPCNKYLQRRIGATLRRKVAEKTYKLESNLYSFQKLQSEKIDP